MAAARAAAHSFSRNSAGKPPPNFPHASRVSCSELLDGAVSMAEAHYLSRERMASQYSLPCFEHHELFKEYALSKSKRLSSVRSISVQRSTF